MGTALRFRYPDFYKDNTNYTVWANDYPRVIDSARLFARGYMGPNSSFGDVYVVNSLDPRAVANSLAPSDLCPLYVDDSGGANATAWNSIYLPPIITRINSMLTGNLTFDTTDVSLFPYLCGFETQITGSRSPWCNVLSDFEVRQYEYAQDLRYYYGTGPGTDLEQKMMLPFLQAVVQRLVDGPNATYTNSDGSIFHPPPLITAFTQDGQINQLAAAIGVFDSQSPLPSNTIPANQTYVASHYVSMRGTIAFERLSCTDGLYVRILLNDAVYPVSSCQSGPGRSCRLQQYQAYVGNKLAAAGDFVKNCNISNSSVASGTEKTTFLTDTELPFEVLIEP